jgi:hypothetical protein
MFLAQSGVVGAGRFDLDHRRPVLEPRIRRAERTAVDIAQKVASKNMLRAVPLSRFQ